MANIFRTLRLTQLSKGLLSTRVKCSARYGCRSFCEESSSPPATEGENRLTIVLKEKFPTASYIHVSDISGGCGSMYDIQIEAEEFRGKRTVLQHRMVNEALKAEIQEMHGLRISTAVPHSGNS